MLNFVIYTYLVDVAFCDFMISGYKFDQGVEITSPGWSKYHQNQLESSIKWIDKELPQVKIWSDFHPLQKQY